MNYRRPLVGVIIVSLGLMFAAVATLRAAKLTGLREATIPQLEQMADRDPFDGEVLCVWGARLAQARRFSEAALILERAIGAGEGDFRVWRSWSATVAAAGDLPHARAILKLGMARQVPDLETATERLQKLGAGTSPQTAADAICPDGITPLLEARTSGSFLNPVVDWWGRRHPETSGFATREQWARDEPFNAQAQRLYGEALLQNGALGQALPVLESAVRLEPASPASHLDLGNLLVAAGNEARAGVEYKACLRYHPDWLPALLGLGQVALDKQLIAVAVQTFEKATRADPDSASAWIGLGRAYYQQRYRPADSLIAFRRGVSLAPLRTDFFGDYSNALRINNLPDEAESVLRRRLAVASEDARSHYLLSLLLLDNQPSQLRADEAEQHLRTSLRLEPNAPATRVELGKLLLRRHRPQEAISLLEEALRQDELNLLAVTTLARAYREVGRTGDALLATQRAKDLSSYSQQLDALEDQEHRNPLDIDIHQKLAALYGSAGEADKSRREAEMAAFIRLHPAEAGKGLTAFNAAASSTVVGSR